MITFTNNEQQEFITTDAQTNFKLRGLKYLTNSEDWFANLFDCRLNIKQIFLDEQEKILDTLTENLILGGFNFNGTIPIYNDLDIDVVFEKFVPRANQIIHKCKTLVAATGMIFYENDILYVDLQTV